ncbi:MAG: polyprenyl diphosphate synthase [Acidimicrobiia bacterium]
MSEEMDLSRLDLERLPRHVGIILDGNGRWAQQRNLPRTAGHQAGEEALFDTVNGALDIGLEWMSVYTFSTENWSRPQEEVEFLMWFNEDLLLRRRDDLHSKGVRILFAGERDDPRIPDRNKRHMAETEALTAGNERMSLVFAFNYGSRVEIAMAARELAARVAQGELDPEKITDDELSEALYVPDMPDVDMVIRTSGELRLSNFLLWQAAYAELVFVDTLWPDFRRQNLADCITEYQHRVRRFGTA